MWELNPRAHDLPETSYLRRVASESHNVPEPSYEDRMFEAQTMPV